MTARLPFGLSIRGSFSSQGIPEIQYSEFADGRTLPQVKDSASPNHHVVPERGGVETKGWIRKFSVTALRFHSLWMGALGVAGPAETEAEILNAVGVEVPGLRGKMNSFLTSGRFSHGNRSCASGSTRGAALKISSICAAEPPAPRLRT